MNRLAPTILLAGVVLALAGLTIAAVPAGLAALPVIAGCLR